MTYQIPEGYKLVPIVPTEEMVNIGEHVKSDLQKNWLGHSMEDDFQHFLSYSCAVDTPEYQALFDAIADATQWNRSESIEISVKAFKEVLAQNGFQVSALSSAQSEPDLINQLQRLLQTIRYIAGIAERGEGRLQRDDETVEQFILGYVKKLEACVQSSEQDKAGCHTRLNSKEAEK